MPKGASKKEEFDVDDKQKRAAKKAKAKRPKGASSAYNIYVAEHRHALSQAEPGLTFGDLSKRVSADWKQLTEEQRRVRTSSLAGVFKLHKHTRLSHTVTLLDPRASLWSLFVLE